ncbi:MAG: AsmA family protein [Candidatus Omnitrophica bacterium]|nr:AsmA family protein [Candidatus Omnitrophota bacterium]
MKILGRLFFIFILFIVLLVLGRNVVLKTAVEKGVRAVTGMPLAIKKLDLGLTRPYFHIEELVIKNPAGFHDTVFVEIPKIFVAYDLPGILKGNIHLTDLEFDLKQFSVVKNEQGRLNLDTLKALQGQKPAQQEKSPAPSKEGKAPEIQIDSFRLRVGKASYVDYSSGAPVTKEFNVGLDEKYANITDPNELVMLIVWKVMMKTPLAMLSNFNLGDLQGSVSGVLGSATDMAGQTFAMGLDKVNAASGQLADQAGDTLKGTADTVTDGAKEAVSSLKNKIKIPF